MGGCVKSPSVSAEIISVGTEILLGHLVNTNTAYLSGKLSGIGIDVFRQTVVGDNPARLSAALKDALRRSDIVITCGGLGPTVDDITIFAISQATSLPLVLNKKIAGSIRKFFMKRRIKMPSYVIKQAYVPKGAKAIENRVGTAPGSIIDRGDKTIVALPGPPRELTPIFENAVIPYLKEKYKVHSIIFSRTIKIAGLPESAINRIIKRFLAMRGAVTTGIYAHLGEVDVKITAKAENKKKALAQIRKTEKELMRVLGKKVYGFDGQKLEEVIGRQLAKRRMTLSVAESCTGGLIAGRITDIPGSSKYFDRGIVTYSDRSKINELGIDKTLIKRYGAVSRHVAIAMAKGILKKSGSDIAIGVTGIAGPGGGTKSKPVGLVYIALVRNGKAQCIERHFTGSRTEIKHQTSTTALELLRRCVAS